MTMVVKLSHFIYINVILLIFKNGALAHYRRVCYYTNWAQYRPSQGKFVVDNIPANLCTHLIYAFATMEGNRLKAFEWNDETSYGTKGMYDRFNGLKNQNPGLKSLLAVGGWNFGTAKMTAMLKTKFSRQEFIKTSIEFLRQRNFDGLDLDFEYPGARGSPKEDKWKFLELVKELRAAFESEARSSGRPPLLLTAAVPAGKDNIDNGYDIPNLARYFDFISIMTYDFHGKWEKKTGHNSPLYPGSTIGNDRFLNMQFAANYWVKQGFPKQHINIGLPLYGRSFTLTTPSQTGVGAPASDGGTAGTFTREKGYLSYYEVCDFLRQPGAKRYWLADQQVPYAVLGDQWVGYDDIESTAIKVKWIKDQGFGGIMVWALDLDDFNGVCSQQPFPLMTVINQVLAGAPVPPPPKIHPQRPPKPHNPPAAPGFPLTKYYQSFGFPPSSPFQKFGYKKASINNNQKHFPSKPQVTSQLSNFRCPGDGHFRHAYYCEIFYECRDGQVTRRECPPQTVYNVMYNVCEYSTTSKCRPFTKPPPSSYAKEGTASKLDNDDFNRFDIPLNSLDKFADFDMSNVNVGSFERDSNKNKGRRKSQNEVLKPKNWEGYNSVGVGFPIFIF